MLRLDIYPRCGLDIFHVHLGRKCIPLHLHVKTQRDQLGPFGLIIHLRFALLIFCFDDLFIGGVLKSHTLLVFALCSEVLLHKEYGWCFHSTSMCLFIGAFNPFTFKVIIDIYAFIGIFLIVWPLFLYVFPSLVFPVCISLFNL